MTEQKILESLKLDDKYFIKDIQIDDNLKEILVTIDLKTQQIKCPECKGKTKIHDKLQKKWRHLDSEDYKVYILYKTPRSICQKHGVKLSEVTWAKRRHHFTKEMENYIYELAQNMPLVHVGKIVDEHDTRIKRIIKGVNDEKTN